MVKNKLDNGQLEHYWHILLSYSRKGKNAVQARKKFYGVYGEDCLIKRQCQRWLVRFHTGNFNVQDAHTGRTTTADDDKMKAYDNSGGSKEGRYIEFNSLRALTTNSLVT